MSINSVTFFSITVGLGAFIYHERYVNKPHTLDDGFSDSGGCSTSVDDSIGRVSHIDCSGLDITTVSSFSIINFLTWQLMLGSLYRYHFLSCPWTTDTQWRHKSKISEKLGRCGRKNMLRPYLKIWEWEWIFGRAVKAISSRGVRSPCHTVYKLEQ